MSISAPTRTVSLLPAGTRVCPLPDVQGASRATRIRGGLEAAAKPFTNTPQVYHTLASEITFQKAAIAPGLTSDATFAGPLAQYGIAAEAVELIRGASIIGAIQGRMRRVPFRVKVPRETGSGTGGTWVGENLHTPGREDRV
jgi:hypothetical protein